MAENREHKVVDKSQVAPATSRTMSFPLSFLDLPYARLLYVKRLFFYHFPHPPHIFYETLLPSLKHNLSLTLQHFFPLTGNLLCPPQPHKPFIRCTDDDSVTLTIVESKAYFNHLSSNHPKNLKDLDHLVPMLTFTTVHGDDDEDTYVSPLVALQVTVFPNHGLCIAITNSHVIMDGRSSCYFIKYWSSICRSGGVDLTTPCFDREVFKDTKGLEAIFLRDYFEERSTWKDKLKLIGQTPNHHEDYVKATVSFGRDDIDGMKRWVLNQLEKNDELMKAPQYLSKFVVTCGFVWASWVKAKYRHDDNNDEDEQEIMKEEYFRFAADCRDRFEYPIPATYVGNCLTRCHAMLKRKELKGEGGFVKAVKGIARAITDMKTEPLKDAENWKELSRKMFVLGSTMLVAGSPKFDVYGTDFGFGKPNKVEMMLHPRILCVTLAESGDKEGGVELGLLFTSSGEFEYFSSVIEQGLATLKS